ncbi:SPFH domain-containing protein [Streptomyces showdoensis]|uniref:SPFH domain-containing protein n=1 Tax=Streptomyces showdoensis TaxID=68268 RepID=UPI000F4E3F61|nr:SPFH domain-containing protein [Streptomyces showdoensis]
MTERQKRPLPVRARWHADGIPMDDLFRADPGAPTTTLPALPRPPRPARPSRPAVAEAEEPQGLPLRPPPDEPELVERGGAAAPGWLAVLVGLSALGGAGTLLWRARPLRAVHLAPWEWAAFGGCVALAVLAFGGLTRGRTGSAWVLSLFGRYRGSVRRTGLVWISPFVLRRRMDVRLRHWRSEPISVVDAEGSALRVVVLVVWSVKDTARALLAVDDHLDYLREQVEAAAARVLSQLPADAFRGDGPTLRDAEAVGGTLTRLLAAECRPVGIAVFSAQPTRIEYAPEVAAAMQRRQIAALDAKHRDSVLTSVIDAVDDTVTRLTSRGLVELDDFERQALVKDLTVAFYTRRGGPAEQGPE